ncbi:MAG: glycosyltransferase [Leptospiraceae bacterium]|nr:glycosyltransferase [Leptospiraceae bacterium]MCP5495971.1 glycosyltransferase [Leptospiraceae bacterium]
MIKLSVVIPIKQGDNESKELLEILPDVLTENCEVVVSSPGKGHNRAYALNRGVEKSSGEFLWFVHGDSRFGKNEVTQLLESIERLPDNLHYFKLRFYPSNFFMSLNSIGANLRSFLIGCPYGDQGLCIKRNIFMKLGGFDETTRYGEDHLFVWKCHQNKIKLNCIDGYIQTSSRKYRNNGWLKTTLLHQFLFFKQAIPEARKLLKTRFFS